MNKYCGCVYLPQRTLQTGSTDAPHLRRGDRKEKATRISPSSSLPSFISHGSEFTPLTVNSLSLQVMPLRLSYFSLKYGNGRKRLNSPGTAGPPTYLYRKQMDHDTGWTRFGIATGANSLSPWQRFGECFLSLGEKRGVIVSLHDNNSKDVTLLPQGGVDSSALHYNMFPFYKT